ncbi:DUF192 domain-containing protein [Patescibacteria group bacterium]|nr:DUF192 domain-containing protein [Patescibacteria group bacterium]
MNISNGVNKNLVLFLIFIFIFLSLVILFFLKVKTNIFDQQSNKKGQSIFIIKINNINLEVEVAETFKEKAQGLSGRERILDNQGMLFVFKTPGRYPFWMKGMKFPIDIIWLDKDLKIVEINKEVQPESFPELLRPSTPIQYVLEVKNGWVDEYSVKQGDQCSLINY